MTKEELKQEAEEYTNNLLFVFETDVVQKIVRERVKLALIDVLEPREKRIEELEGQVTRAFEVLEGKRKRIEELEQENAELKEKLSNAETSNEWYRRSSYGSLFDLITKAREIIKKLYSYVFQGMDFMEPNDFNVLKAEAENFLKESEVEK